MSLLQGAVSGGAIGVLLVFAVCMVLDIPTLDTVYRMLVVGVAGAWMGMLLVWLNDLLPRDEEPDSRQPGMRT